MRRTLLTTPVVRPLLRALSILFLEDIQAFYAAIQAGA